MESPKPGHKPEHIKPEPHHKKHDKPMPPHDVPPHILDKIEKLNERLSRLEGMVEVLMRFQK